MFKFIVSYLYRVSQNDLDQFKFPGKQNVLKVGITRSLTAQSQWRTMQYH